MFLFILASLVLEGGTLQSCPSGVENVAHESLPNHYWHCTSAGEPPSLRNCGDDVYVVTLGTCMSNSSSVVTRLRRSVEDPKFKEIVEVESIGEIVTMGALYNMRKSKIYSASNLFKSSDIEQKLKDVECQSSIFEVTSERGNLFRRDKLGVSVGVILKLFFGLITIRGSASYLQDEKVNAAIARVSMSLHSTNRCKTIPITMNPNTEVCKLVKESSGPTHVVTSLTTGLRSIFLYEKQTKSIEQVNQVSGNLAWVIRKIPVLKVNKNGEGIYKKEMEDVKVKFYGDANIENYPSDYMEAYKSVEEVLKQAKTSQTPIKYQLTPIEHFCDSKIAKVIELNVQLTESATNALVGMQETIQDIRSLLRRKPAINSAIIKAQLILLETKVLQLESSTKLKLQRVYELIKTGEKKEVDLAQIIADHEKHRFSSNNIKPLMNYLTRQMNTVAIVTDKPSKENNIMVSYSGSASDNNCIFNTRHSFVLTIHVLAKEDLISVYEKDGTVPKNSWFDDVQRVSTVGGLLDDFVTFSLHNQDDDKCYLLRMDSLKAEQPDLPDAEVGVYTNGIKTLELSDFVVQTPLPRCHESDYNELQITTTKSDKPMVVGHTVETLRIVPDPNDAKKNTTETLTTANANTAVIRASGLQPNTTYTIRTYYTLKHDLGRMIPSEWIQCSTAPTSKPVEVQVLAAHSSTLTVSWLPPQKPQNAKEGLNYSVAAINGAGRTESQVVTSSLSANLTLLTAATKYTIQVRAMKDGALSQPGVVDTATLPLPLQRISVERIDTTEADLSVSQENVQCPTNAVKDDIILEIAKMDSAGSKVFSGSTITRIIDIKDANSPVKYKLTNLLPGSTYLIRSKVRLSVGGKKFETGYSDGYILTTPPDNSDTSTISAELTTLLANRDATIASLGGDKDAVTAEMNSFRAKVDGLLNKVREAEARVQAAIKKSHKIADLAARLSCRKPGVLLYDTSPIDTLTNVATPEECSQKCLERSSCEAVIYEYGSKKCKLLRDRAGDPRYIMTRSMLVSINLICHKVAKAPMSTWDKCKQVGTKLVESSIDEVNDMTFEGCVQHCTYTNRCMGVSYNKAISKCLTKQGVASKTKSDNYDSITLRCLYEGQ